MCVCVCVYVCVCVCVCVCVRGEVGEKEDLQLLIRTLTQSSCNYNEMTGNSGPESCHIENESIWFPDLPISFSSLAEKHL